MTYTFHLWKCSFSPYKFWRLEKKVIVSHLQVTTLICQKNFKNPSLTFYLEYFYQNFPKKVRRGKRFSSSPPYATLLLITYLVIMKITKSTRHKDLKIATCRNYRVFRVILNVIYWTLIFKIVKKYYSEMSQKSKLPVEDIGLFMPFFDIYDMSL